MEEIQDRVEEEVVETIAEEKEITRVAEEEEGTRVAEEKKKARIAEEKHIAKEKERAASTTSSMASSCLGTRGKTPDRNPAISSQSTCSVVSEGRDRYLVRYDWTAREEDEIGLVKGEVGRGTSIIYTLKLYLSSRSSQSYQNTQVMTTTGKEKPTGSRAFSPTHLLRRRRSKIFLTLPTLV